jgi:hypothetical protein
MPGLVPGIVVFNFRMSFSDLPSLAEASGHTAKSWPKLRAGEKPVSTFRDMR